MNKIKIQNILKIGRLNNFLKLATASSITPSNNLKYYSNQINTKTVKQSLY
jgi:hypothetical protein